MITTTQQSLAQALRCFAACLAPLTDSSSLKNSFSRELHPGHPIPPLGPRGTSRVRSPLQLRVWEAPSVLRCFVSVQASAVGGHGPSIWLLPSALQVWRMDTILASVSACSSSLRELSSHFLPFAQRGRATTLLPALFAAL